MKGRLLVVAMATLVAPSCATGALLEWSGTEVWPVLNADYDVKKEVVLSIKNVSGLDDGTYSLDFGGGNVAARAVAQGDPSNEFIHFLPNARLVYVGPYDSQVTDEPDPYRTLFSIIELGPDGSPTGRYVFDSLTDSAVAVSRSASRDISVTTWIRGSRSEAWEEATSVVIGKGQQSDSRRFVTPWLLALTMTFDAVTFPILVLLALAGVGDDEAAD